jgi:hypothetical protein
MTARPAGDGPEDVLYGVDRYSPTLTTEEMHALMHLARQTEIDGKCGRLPHGHPRLFDLLMVKKEDGMHWITNSGIWALYDFGWIEDERARRLLRCTQAVFDEARRMRELGVTGVGRVLACGVAR